MHRAYLLRPVVTYALSGFTLALPASELPHLRAFLSAVATEFRQKAIYLSVAGEVEFVRGDS